MILFISHLSAIIVVQHELSGVRILRNRLESRISLVVGTKNGLLIKKFSIAHVIEIIVQLFYYLKLLRLLPKGPIA